MKKSDSENARCENFYVFLIPFAKYSDSSTPPPELKDDQLYSINIFYIYIL